MSIFISYRRTDNDYALLLYAWLKERFGRERVFWDKEDIEAGQDFAEVLRDRISSAKVLIALIGRDWLSMTDENGRRRLDSPSDWVRVEIATALAKMVVVLPVLASGVGNLREPDLPDDLKKLARLQSLELSDARFHGRLIDTLDKVVPSAVRAQPQPQGAEQPTAVTRRIGTLLGRQVQRLQVRAVELIGERKLDRAMEELHEGSYLLMELLELSPQDVKLDVQLGYLYKTLAQAFDAAEDRENADRYLELAYSVFQRVKEDTPAAAKTAAETAGALNGLGNIYYQRGQPEEAIRYYRLALEIDPTYAYAWHDLFGAYVALADKGNLDLAAMGNALQKAKETGAGLPGLASDYLAQLVRHLREWEQRPQLDPGAEAYLTAVIAQGRDDADVYVARGKARVIREDYGGAEADFTAAMTRGWDDAEVYLQRGWVRFNQHDFAGAEADARAATARGRNDSSVYYLLGRARAGQADYAGAEAHFTAAIEQERDDAGAFLAEVFFRRAGARLIQNDFAGTEADLTAAIAHGLDNAVIRHTRGTTRYHLGNSAGAEEDLTAAIARGQHDASVYLLRGKVRLAQRNPAGAEADLTAAIEGGQGDAEVYHFRGMARVVQHKYHEAEADLTAAIERGRNDASLYYFRGRARINQEKDAEAEADLTTAIARGQSDALVYFWRGRTRFNLNDFSGAESDLNTAITQGQDDAAVFYWLGRTRFAQNDYAGAERHFTTAISRGQDDADVHRFRGFARTLQGDSAGAEADFTAALARGQDEASIYFLRGLARQAQEHYGAAETDFTAAIARGQDDASVYQNRAFAHVRLEQLEHARQDCQHAEQRAPDDPFTHGCWGHLHLALGEYNAAIDCYQSALRAGSGGGWQLELGLAFLLAGRFDEAKAAYHKGLIDAPATEVKAALRELDFWMARQADRVTSLDAQKTISIIRQQLEASSAQDSLKRP